MTTPKPTRPRSPRAIALSEAGAKLRRAEQLEGIAAGHDAKAAVAREEAQKIRSKVGELFRDVAGVKTATSEGEP